MAIVRVPALLRRFVKDKPEIEANGSNLKEVIENLKKNYPEIIPRLCDADGSVKKFINIYIDGEDIRFLKGIDSKVLEKSEVNIVPAIAGG